MSKLINDSEEEPVLAQMVFVEFGDKHAWMHVVKLNYDRQEMTLMTKEAYKAYFGE